MEQDQAGKIIATLNSADSQNRIFSAARAAVREQLKKEGLDASPQDIASALLTRARAKDASDIIAAGAVLVAVLSL